MSSHSSSTTSLSSSNFIPGAVSTIINDFAAKPGRPFIHPTISRLRSFVPPQHHQPMASISGFPNSSPSPSHFSTISRVSSLSNFGNNSRFRDEPQEATWESFRWAILRDVGQQIYLHKAAAILGSFHGSPTVLSANGLICIGTDRGRVLVFDFKQQLKCVCGPDDSCKTTHR